MITIYDIDKAIEDCHADDPNLLRLITKRRDLIDSIISGDRFFYVSFLDGNSQGSTMITSEGYPKKDTLKDALREISDNLINPIVINITEVTKQDYEDYTE